MSQEILINVSFSEIRVALLEDGVLQEIHIERSLSQGLLGNIYKGRITRLLPGIQSAFVDIGLERSAFLHVSDMGLTPLSNASPDSLYPDITTCLKPGQDILVQVYKNPLGTKGARLTTQFTLPSRYLVLTPKSKAIAVSQRLTDERERERLIGMIEPSDAGGYIFRTVAEGCTVEAIKADQVFLERVWASIKAREQEAKAGQMIYTEIPMVLRVLRDMVGTDAKTIRVDDYDAALSMQAYAKQYMPSIADRIEFFADNLPIFDLYSVESELKKALESKVYLPSGGHIVFDQTEAMTTIDVNTGSFIGKNNLENTVFKTNTEAISVIARQIRLRNLGGIIIIDFIDMNSMQHKEELLQALQNALALDSAKIQMSELTSLGLVQLTRKRTRESIEHILCEPCPLCHHRGFIKSPKTMCYEIFRELKRVAPFYVTRDIVVIVAPAVASVMLQKESALLQGLEKQLNKFVEIRSEPTFTQEHYDIFPLSEKE